MDPGDRLRVEREGTVHEGILLPSSTDRELVVKLDGGYNVGIDRETAQVEVLAENVHDIETAQEVTTTSTVETDPDLPTIALVTTGGTIASTVDYRTGAVTARFGAEDVLRAVPELAGRANYRGRVVANILSENMEPSLWQDLAEAVQTEIDAGVDGVVVMHGTDTMQYSAAALAFMFDLPVPVIFTGSQRSADRPSSDNVMNAVCAVEAAKSDCAEVLVCLHAGTADNVCALHRGTRVRKAHTSRRSAFETVGQKSLGRVTFDDRTVQFRRDYRSRREDSGGLKSDLEEDVHLVKFVPGMGPDQFEALRGAAGLVVEGTGLGHVSTDLVPILRDLINSGTTVVMTSQCLEGRVCDRVYDTGRDLLDAGVIEAENTLPETALVKLMWALGNDRDPTGVMHRSLAGELTDRSVPWI